MTKVTNYAIFVGFNNMYQTYPLNENLETLHVKSLQRKTVLAVLCVHLCRVTKLLKYAEVRLKMKILSQPNSTQLKLGVTKYLVGTPTPPTPPFKVLPGNLGS